MTIDSQGKEPGYAAVPSTNEPKRKYVQEPIAVVGMACRLPGESNTPKALWDLLLRGGVARNEAPESRFNLSTHYDGSTRQNTMRSPGGMFLENIDPKDFDAQFFGTPGADAIAMDPQQRQLLEVVYECLENSGITLESLSGAPYGCFVGSYSVDYEHVQARDPEDRAPGVTIGVGRAILSNRISHFLNIKGPSMTIDTACSGSLVSTDVACRYLSTGEIDGAIVAGANLYLSPEHVMDTGAMKGAASLSGKCHTFDVKADGYIKAEGVNAVVLKRLSDAIRDGDPIRGVIRGIATNSDGYTPGIASPSAEAQAMAVRAAYANAGIADFNDTTYLEFHGTGTQAGDPTEVNGVASIFSPTRDPKKPLYIGSIKSNIGHSEPAAGISGLLKAILTVEKGIIPGNPTFIDPTPKIDFGALKISPSRVSRPWPRGAPRRASVNSFGYGGSNVHVVIDEAASFAKPAHVQSFISDDGDIFGSEAPKAGRPSVLVFSANDDQSLQGCFANLQKHLVNPQVKVDLQDLSYTLSERRSHLYHRGFIVTNSLSLDEVAFVRGKKTTNPPVVGFVFTGQGAQWPQMGKALVETFPSARLVLTELDEALQSIPHPPSWRLIDELTQPRSPEVLRQPEFSQPLVTALQLVLVEVLAQWNIFPQSVVGHSSGEIAAACAAGLISQKDAIVAAYYRGLAAIRSPAAGLGMLAAGISAAEFPNYTQGVEGEVSIACFNSPQSVTISGPVKALEVVKDALVSDKKFARLLQVDLAYHSKFMSEIGNEYHALLSEQFSSRSSTTNVRMFSSVTGEALSTPADSEYWKANMVSPVLFDQAVTGMLRAESAPDFIVEIGPSGALAGPIAQIKKNLQEEAGNVQYCAALSRAQNSVKSTFEVAGKLFVAGGSVDLVAVNQLGRGEQRPKVIVDLPNYSWNHSAKYWYENESSKDWRYRLFPHHDLLGSKVLGSPWNEPSFKKKLRVENLPWLKDHKMGPDIVFPAAGFLAMAIEAIRQKTAAQVILDNKPGFKDPSYRARNLTFPRALVLEEGKEHTVMLSLTESAGGGGSWHTYRVSSLIDGIWREHSQGLIKAEDRVESVAPADAIRPLEYPTDGMLWYKAMNDAGYNFGPAFRKQLQVESVSGSRYSRSTVSLEEPGSEIAQSPYPIHPACIDGCFQTCAPSLWAGHRSDVSAVLIPAIIDEVIINERPKSVTECIAASTSRFIGLGRQSETKSYLSNSSVYDPITGNLLFQVTGLRYHKLDTREEVYSKHNYSRVVWDRDITTTSNGTDLLGSDIKSPKSSLSDASRLADIVAHKKPHLTVLEINLVPGRSTSIWLDGSSLETSARAACRKCRLAFDDASSLLTAQERYASHDTAEFSIMDTNSVDSVAEDEKFDFVILNVASDDLSSPDSSVVAHAQRFLRDDAHFLLLQYEAKKSDNAPTTNHINGTIYSSVKTIFTKQYSQESDEPTSVAFGVAATAELKAQPTARVELVHFANPTITAMKTREKLIACGWHVTETRTPSPPSDGENIIHVVLEFGEPLLPSLTPSQWDDLKSLLNSDQKVLWVTEGSQMDVTIPEKAMIHGLGRTVRAEDPTVNLTTLDVERPESLKTIHAIVKVLEKLEGPPPKKHIEHEFVERGGHIYVPRIVPDHPINQAEAEVANGKTLVDISLHDAKTTVKLQCDRVGTLDGLNYTEVDGKELPLLDNRVEVELYAAGLNFKDVAITMGIVPENEHLLGLEGAGIVRRVHESVSGFKPGDRVLVFEKGTFANRVIATTERTYHIPDSMSFEEASTLASVYLTALYSIYDLANTQKGHRVLIHSATGGLGQASIQICNYIGAEVYATVGSEEKVQYLVDTYGISRQNIFNSRSTAFAKELMDATDGKGVDVILNSLTGELLEESWRCIATGGTMVELGKKDMLDRNYLSMEPFGRNASYRCFDMSHKHVSDQLIARLLDQLMPLVSQGHLRPIGPIKTFSFTDIPSAFRFMRGANHIGKIVITDGPDAKITVPARPAPRKLTLREDVSYLLIGGLKGLCGTVAIQLARLGAKHLVVLARSGYNDEKSKAVIRNVEANGCAVTLVIGDVAAESDVERCFEESPVPVGGIVQGAMVLRDRPFSSMTITEYHQAIEAKVKGTWNLHNASVQRTLPLDFFMMLSSISGVVGQRGQCNYSAANVFLDSFALYRRKLGLRACTVDLGAIEDVGYMFEHNSLLVKLDTAAWTPINEALFNKIFRVALLQDIAPINAASAGQLITSIAAPQAENSQLLSDARFGPLCFGGEAGRSGSEAAEGAKEVQALLLLLKSEAAPAAVLNAAIDAVNKQMVITLRLTEPMEPGKPLNSYGMDSLAAVEFRNWARSELKAELTTLEIANASSLHSLCERIVSKMKST